MSKSNYRIRANELYETGTVACVWYHTVDPSTDIFAVLKSPSIFIEASDKLRPGDMVVLSRFKDGARTELAERAQVLILRIDGVGVTWLPVNHWHGFSRARLSKATSAARTADAPMADDDLRIEEVPAGFGYEKAIGGHGWVVTDPKGATIEHLKTEEECQDWIADPGLCPTWFGVFDARGREVKRFPTRQEAVDHVRRHDAAQEAMAA